MHIAWMRIRNFKTFKSAEFHFNSDINVLTGVNNSGKTTVLEAIALWAECFRRLLRRADRAVTKLGVRKGDYRLGDPKHNYFDHAEIVSVRSTSYGDIFHDLAHYPEDFAIELQATLEHEEQSLTIGFTIRRSTGGTYDIVQMDANRFDVGAFNELFERFPQPLNVVYASPVAFLRAREEFETRPKIAARIDAHQSMQVLRNRLYQLKKDSPRYTGFLDSIAYVLFGGEAPVELFFVGDEGSDVRISVYIQLGPKDFPKEISLLGSGTLQIIELMLSVHAEPKDLNLVLLDEPDSHIHRDIQRRLMETLAKHTTATQVFLTTHNESLIRSADARHLFHLEPGQTKEYHPVYRDKADARKRGLQPSRQIKILKSLGSETSLDLLNAIEADRLVLVEGEDDARFIQAIVERETYPSRAFHAMYWSFEGIDNLLANILTYKDIFSQIRNDRALWDKSRTVLVIDRDYLTDEQREQALAGLTQKLGIPVHIWRSYTVEATVLSDIPRLKKLLRALLRQKPYDVHTTLEDVGRHVDRLLAELLEKHRQRLDDVVVLRGIFEQLKTKRERLHGLGLPRKLIGADSELQPVYQRFARALLDRGEVHHLATKEDVATLVQGVLGAFSVATPRDLFEALIQATDPSTRFPEWDELTKAIG